MVGISFGSFLVLLIVSVVVSALLHYGLAYYIIPGFSSFCSKVVVGWIGAWLGSPVFGHWFAGLAYEQVYYIPAILGALALEVLAVDVVRTLGGVAEEGEPSAPTARSATERGPGGPGA